uniref:AlNc14C303G10407 protein n=1 Tax=Albugo laibachii Nc14 TaxID=890382 RepID=F0WVR9_9STRA|nr:AlNc14C303G10407 [Albugo laibachii Nc14]|eukprot:CCA25515.1 AlNc14C303G10407 [Albugo laibachii Nc14]
MPPTRTTTQKPAWNASTKTRQSPATRTPPSTAKRVGGGYVPSVSSRATRRTTSTEPVTARTPRTVRRTTGVRVGSSGVERTDGSAAQSLLKELNQVKRKNAELSQALEEKTLQLNNALQEVSLLKMANQGVSKQLEACRMEQEAWKNELDKAFNVIEGAEKDMDVEMKLEVSALTKSEDRIEAPALTIGIQAKEHYFSENEYKDEAFSELSYGKKSGGIQFNEDARTLQKCDEENSSNKSKGIDELKRISLLSEQEQDQIFWDLFQEFYEEEKTVQWKRIEDLKNNNQQKEMKRCELEWNLFEDLINDQKLKEGCK